jgi:hypothetical protein
MKNGMKLLIGMLIWSVTGCGLAAYEMAGGSDSEQGTRSIFPRPVGEWIIPLKSEPAYFYHYTEIDEEGKRYNAIQDLELAVRHIGSDIYAFDWQNNNKGHLLIFEEDRDYDTAGIYIVGEFNDTVYSFSDSVLWIPQVPQDMNSKSWNSGPDISMTCISSDTGYFTQSLFYGERETRDNEADFQEHHAFLFEEVSGSYRTFYYFRPGIGLLGFERTLNGKTVAIGTLHRWSRSDTVTYY